ncbi:hypothetical protein LA304_10995 [Celeribacter sp. ASW11-22]|nr:hypothetical protein [Celeribacter litoreus]
MRTRVAVYEILPIGEIGTDTLYIGNRPVELPRLADRLEVAGQDGDLLLVRLGSFGTACPNMWVFVDATKAPAKVSDMFGTCHDSYEVRVGADGLELRTPSVEPDESGDMRYWFADGVVHEELGPPTSLGLNTVSEWGGEYPKFLVNDPMWEGAMLTHIGPVGLLDLRSLFEMQSAFEWEGDWLVATGCRTDACGSLGGVLALSRDGSRMVAMVHRDEGAPKDGLAIYGDDAGDLPHTLIEFQERWKK